MKNYIKEILCDMLIFIMNNYIKIFFFINKKHIKKYYSTDMVFNSIICIRKIYDFKIGVKYKVYDYMLNDNVDKIFINISDEDVEYTLPRSYLIYFVDEEKYNIFLADDRQKKLDKLIK